MLFGDILTAVCTDGIPASKRADAKNWVRFRHSWLWDLEPWTFKFATADVTFAAGSQTVTDAPADLHATLALYDYQGDPLRGYSDPRKFYDTYNPNIGNGSRTPEAYTLIGSSLIVGPAGDGSTGFLVYEKSKPMLNDDSDETGLPDGYDLALVHGGKAEGFKLTNIPLADNFDADFTAAVNALKAGYLSNVHETGGQVGAYRPGLTWR